MRISTWRALPLVAVLASGCNCGHKTGTGDAGHGDGGPNQNACQPPSNVTVSPPTASTSTSLGASWTQTFTATADGQDVTSQAFFKLSDPTLGTFNGNTFTWSGTHAGTATVTAQFCGVKGTATITITIPGGVLFGTGTINPGMAQGQFAGAGTSNNAACTPTLLYPTDGVLIPPNTNVIEVHFMMGTPPNNLFEVSFTNGITNEFIYTNCTGATPADGMPLNGGCIVELSQAEWDYMAQTNRGGDPVTVKVRGLGCDGTNAASSATRQISFGQEDLVGTLYYWASMRVGGMYNSGGIYRYEFGKRGQTAEAVLTPTSTAAQAFSSSGACIGCHSISLDGRKMVFDFDDNDSDDEYHDVYTAVWDIAAQTSTAPIVRGSASSFPPGYHTWNHETTEFLLSDGFPSGGKVANPVGAFWRVSPAGTGLGFTMSGTLRGTTPDWAPDDAHVVFASPPDVSATPPNPGYWPASAQGGSKDDLWFAGASIYMAVHNMDGTLGTPVAFLPASGTLNFYYPAFSSDGSLVVFNEAPSGANFHNPLARVKVVPANQSNPTPTDLPNLNDHGVPAGEQPTNSWARWSPFPQSYKSSQILWVTFSSTRDYGLRIENGANQNCYPREAPTGFADFTVTANCSRTQIWMAAVRLDTPAVQGGQDVSWPAFLLPFQDITTNNHLAQWAQQRFTGTCTKNSDCIENGCCTNGACASCPVLPPSCSQNVNCAPGQCCQVDESGAKSCQSCNGAHDGGTPVACNTCIDCGGQACKNHVCGSCTTSADCCAGLACVGGSCGVNPQ